MSVTTDYPDFSPHVALAQQVAATGVPLLHGANVLLNSSNVVIPASGHQIYTSVAFTQPSYEIFVSCFANAASGNPFAELTLTWTDSVSGITIARDIVTCAAGSVVSGWVTFGRGPTKADLLSVQAGNLDAAHSMTFSITVLQTSRIFDRDTWRWDNNGNSGNAIPGFTLPALPDDDAILGTVNGGAIIANGNSEWLFGPGYGGTVTFSFAITTTPIASIIVTMIARPTTIYGNTAYLFRGTFTSGSNSISFKPSRSPILLQVNNSSATAGSLFCGMSVGQDG